MRAAVLRLALALAVWPLVAPVARADVVVLKNGAEFDGLLVSEAPDSLVFQSENVQWTFQKALVASVKRDEATRRQELARTAAHERTVANARRLAAHPVVVYGTSWCGWCRRTTEFLTARGVAFVEKDIEHDPVAAAEVARLRRRAGIRSAAVPVIDVGGTIILGYDVPRLKAALAARR